MRKLNPQKVFVQYRDRMKPYEFEKEPNLDNTPVFIHFISSNPAYDKTYDFFE
ncbi:MAG: Staygreen protein [Herbinix sp.]|jgi:hypothetical protein|nr:Staygreen protein [Herbinix sp.]